MPLTPTPASLQGRWTRSRLSWPDGRCDVSSVVTWLQGPTLYADLRQPPGLAEAMTGVMSLRGLTLAQVQALAEQEGFAGTLIHHRDASFEWQRQIDFQPQTGRADRGFLNDAGSMMVETGYAEPYTEHWHRSAETTVPSGALALNELGSGRVALIVRVGEAFLVARDRTSKLRDGHLRDHVAAASSREAAQDLIDCEISLGVVTDIGWRIERSSLPYRVGQVLAPRIEAERLSTADVDPHGEPMERVWTITARNGGFVVA